MIENKKTYEKGSANISLHVVTEKKKFNTTKKHFLVNFTPLISNLVYLFLNLTYFYKKICLNPNFQKHEPLLTDKNFYVLLFPWKTNFI